MWNAGGRGIVLLGFEQANCYTVLEGSVWVFLLRTWAASARLWASEECKLAATDVKSYSASQSPGVTHAGAL